MNPVISLQHNPSHRFIIDLWFLLKWLGCKTESSVWGATPYSWPAALFSGMSPRRIKQDCPDTQCCPLAEEASQLRSTGNGQQWDYRLCHTADSPGGTHFVFVNSLSSSREFDEEERRLHSSINPNELSKKEKCYSSLRYCWITRAFEMDRQHFLNHIPLSFHSPLW